jgi:hypothetical protein
MNTLANAPVPGLAPLPAVAPESVVAEIVAAASPIPRSSTWCRVKDILVMIYAYGLLGFGLFFPLLLAAWSLFLKPAAE